ncbi:MAG: hypothetical protein EHM93_02255 [Bacteroidales bacterium]|nr:MAG: hypothetical protein EHM93_02255 [Bacteroidales bacterium]
MKRKYWLVIASVIMILIGVLRGIGGISLFQKGNQLITDIPIIATNPQISLIAFGLLLICALFIFAAINLIRKNSRRSWIFCWLVLLLFLLGGLLNGYILFGHPIDKGQMINFIAVFIVSIFLYTGKTALKDTK